MTSSQNFEDFIPPYIDIPDEWDNAKPLLVEQLRQLANAVNTRDSGWLLDQEIATGQNFIPGTATPPQFRSVLRKVIDFGGLPNNATKSVAHGINVDINFTLISLCAAASDPVNLNYVQIPYASNTANRNIELDMDNANVNITTSNAIDWSVYTRAFVFISYIQEP